MLQSIPLNRRMTPDVSWVSQHIQSRLGEELRIMSVAWTVPRGWDDGQISYPAGQRNWEFSKKRDTVGNIDCEPRSGPAIDRVDDQFSQDSVRSWWSH